MPHHIRLAGPWDQRESLDDSADWKRCQLPVKIGPTIQVRRRFHRPSGLDEKSQVFIVIQAAESVQAKLNDQDLTAVAVENELVFAASDALISFNTLILRSTEPSDVVQVRIRIEEAAD